MSGEPRDPEQESHPAEPTGEESVATLVRPPGEERTQELARSTPDSSGDLDLDLPRLQPDELLAGRFSIVRFIARGGMGAVRGRGHEPADPGRLEDHPQRDAGRRFGSRAVS